LQVPKQRTRKDHVPHRERPRGGPAESRDPAHDLVPSLARDRNRDQDRDRDPDPDQSRDQGQGRGRGRGRGRSRVRARIHVHVHVHIHHPNLDRRLDRARVLSRVRHLNHVVNHDLDLAVLNRGIRRDLDPSRDRARERLRSHRRDLGRAHDPSPGRSRDRDLVPVAVAVPLARAAKAAPRASESRSAIENTNVIDSNAIIFMNDYFDECSFISLFENIYISDLVISPNIRIIVCRAKKVILRW